MTTETFKEYLSDVTEYETPTNKAQRQGHC